MRYAAELLASTGRYNVVSCDLPGHGKSGGLQGLLPPPDELIALGVQVAEYAIKRFENTSKLFLLGSSMGGTIALAVARDFLTPKDTQSTTTAVPIGGVVLLAPMLKLSVSGPEHFLLSVLASTFISSWKVIPSSSSDSEKQYRDEAKRKECNEDEYSNSGGSIRVGSAYSCVELASRMTDEFFAGVDFPFLLMVADEDVIVNNEGSLALFESAGSQDKTLKRYPALHGLLCEPSPLLETIQDDMLHWMDSR